MVSLFAALKSRLRGLLNAFGLDPDQPWGSLLFSVIFLPLPADPWSRPLWTRMAALFPHVDFSHLGPGDAIRIPVQLLWLGLAKPRQHGADRGSWWRGGHTLLAAVRIRLLAAIPEDICARVRGASAMPRHLLTLVANCLERPARLGLGHSRWNAPAMRYAAYTAAAALTVLSISTPFDPHEQLVFLLLLWGVALLARRMPGQAPALLLILLSVTVSTRYLWWRVLYTLNWDNDFDLLWGLLLLAAEFYAWLVLLFGYFQMARPLRRNPLSMPEDMSLWPSVDIYIPTYNEPLKVVTPTIIAAKSMDWPADKLNVYVLDDGRREEFRHFAEEIGVGYIVRPDSRHAKAGNLNHALGMTSGEFVTVFDCDHVPTCSFLRSAMGWFLRDKRLALVQTPHHFFSPDPFERNLGVFRSMPNEGELFHGLIQDGNDLWNATFFCGSCAVLRRKPLEEVGGIAVETVTEDAHTALKLQRRGYTTALVNIPLAAGLATESLSSHIGQRIRWARGMAQIFRLDNPFFGKGLNWAQRICYGSSMLHFFNGAPRLIFLTAPLAFLLFHGYVIHAAAIEVALYVLPHLVHAQIANSRLQGEHRHSFWAEVYETVLAWYIVRPTTVALLDPHKGKFNVTPKGGLMPTSQFDWTISRPYLLLAALNLLGFCVGIARGVWGPADEVGTTLLNLFWTLYNLMLLGTAIAVAAEAKQTRLSHRAPLHQPAVLHLRSGLRIHGQTEDLSQGGAALRLPAIPKVRNGDPVTLTLRRGNQSFDFPARVVSLANPYLLRLSWELTSREQDIALVQCTLARSDAWASSAEARRDDRPLRSLGEVLSMGITGYGRLGAHALSLLSPLTTPLAPKARRLWRGIQCLLPHTPTAYPFWLQSEDLVRSFDRRSDAVPSPVSCDGDRRWSRPRASASRSTVAVAQ